MKVLIIEPDLVLARAYKKAFQTGGIKTDMCHNAQTAVKLIEINKPDCIVMELQLAGHSGIEFLHEFRSYEDWADIAVYIYSIIPLRNFESTGNIIKSLDIKNIFYKSKTPVEQLIGIIKSELEAK